MKVDQQVSRRTGHRWASCALLIVAMAAQAFSQTLDSFNPGAGGQVSVLAVRGDGSVLAGGMFTTLGGQSRAYLGLLNRDGSLSSSFDSGTDGLVSALAVQADGSVLVGGAFKNLAGQPVGSLGRLNPDGSLDTAFTPSAGNGVNALAVQPNGQIVVGGSFLTLGGLTRTALGRLNIDGSVDIGFNPGPTGTIYCVAMQIDGKILVGGSFTNLGGQNINNLGRLNADGTTDTNFSGVADGPVYALAVQSDSKILVGGSFQNLDTQSHVALGRLNGDGSLDTAFTPTTTGVTAVEALALQADSNVVVGGSFQNIDGQAMQYLARLNGADGSLDTNFLSVGLDNTVDCLALQSDGGILMGGAFQNVGTTPRASLARLVNPQASTSVVSFDGSTITWACGGSCPSFWRTTFESSTDGVNWTLLGSGTRTATGWRLTGASGAANQIIRAHGFVAGSGQNWYVEDILNGEPIFSVEPVGQVVPLAVTATFTAQATGMPALTYQWRKNDAALADRGEFSGTQTPTLTITDVTGADSGSYSLLVSNPYGSSVSRAAALTVVDPMIISQPVSQTNGAFATATFNVTVASSVVPGYQWFKGKAPLVDAGNVSGSQTASLTISNALAANDGGYSVLVTNRFGRITSVVATLQVFDPFIATQPTNQFATIGQSVVFNVSPAATAPVGYQWQKNGTNLVGATLASLSLSSVQRSDAGAYDVIVTNALGRVTSLVAALSVNLSLADTLNPIVDNAVYSLTEQSDGKILVAGSFTNLGGLGIGYLGRLFSNGQIDPQFNPGPDQAVSAVAIQPDGKILVGGQFTQLSAEPVANLARLNVDGSLDLTFNGTANGSILALALQPDGRILVSGNFTMLDGQPSGFLGRLNADGSFDTNFNNVLPDNTVNTLVLQPDGRILIGGYFTSLGQVATKYLARLNADGSLDQTFKAAANSWVYSLALQSDSRILAAGVFTQLDGQNRNCLARLNTNGTLDATFNPAPNDIVYSMSVQADGNVLIGGKFTMVAGQPRSYLARVEANGVLDGFFNPGANGTVQTLCLQSDGKVLAGGSFTSLGGLARSYLGRVSNSDPVVDSLTFTGANINWLRGGTEPEVWYTTFDTSTNGTNWVALGAGTRTAGGWQLTGLSLPVSNNIRARGYLAGGGIANWFVQTLFPTISTTPPVILRTDGFFGIMTNQFGFNILGSSGQVIQVEASSDLLHWVPVTTVTLGGGPYYFSDPASTNTPYRFYQVQLQ